jgi:formylglycine-generating enzyme required for sulfatase activity
MKYCPNCRKSYPNTCNYCISCGKFLQPSEDESAVNLELALDLEKNDSTSLIECPNCQEGITDYSRYCHHCGVKIKGGGGASPHFKSPSRKLILILLGIMALAALVWVGVKYIDFSKPVVLGQVTPSKTTTHAGYITSTPTIFIQLPTAESTATDEPNGPKDMVNIPGGSFIMGGSESDIQWHLDSCNHYANCDIVDYNDMDPKHDVELDSFYMDVHEVTNAQYRNCVDAGVCQKPDQTAITKYLDGDYYSNTTYNDYPVVAISWSDASTFCQWDGGKQLPSEAQWEKAAQGPDGWYFPWIAYPGGYTAYSVFGGATTLANFCDANCPQQWKDSDLSDGYKGTAPVMSFPPNAYGLYDMAGNVTEWTRDYYNKNFYSSSPTGNPVNTTSSEWRVTRGGGWNNGIYYLTSIFRSAQDANKATAFLGFRCVKFN